MHNPIIKKRKKQSPWPEYDVSGEVTAHAKFSELIEAPRTAHYWPVKFSFLLLTSFLTSHVLEEICNNFAL
jgi:hypothetical protein